MVPLTSALFLKPGSGNLFDVDSKGKLIYLNEEFKKQLFAGETILIKWHIDHLDFLTDYYIINIVKTKLKLLN